MKLIANTTSLFDDILLIKVSETEIKSYLGCFSWIKESDCLAKSNITKFHAAQKTVELSKKREERFCAGRIEFKK
jgi:hypothetical protein